MPRKTTHAELDAAERLRAAGLRSTRPRTLVYAVLREVGGHRSVDDVVDLLEKRGHSIPRMTIYNVMADLTGASLVMPADTGPGKALYEASDVWHHHFVCRGCGGIEDVPCWKGRKPCLRPPVGPSGSIIDEAQVIFRGLCAECAKSSAKGKRS
ncbi:MAG TPA: Fur family transcriptional regulator [Candidatus Polarisedimenticolaceae bacterium]